MSEQQQTQYRYETLQIHAGQEAALRTEECRHD